MSELASALMQHRVDIEAAELRRELERRTIYQPKKKYTVGEELVFPALKAASGKVISQRAGRNPEIEPFDVITVEMPGGKHREFAANYTRPHRLNDDNVLAILSDDSVMSTTQELVEQYGERISQVIDTGLAGDSEFLRIGGDWFLRAMMAEVNVGHLNLSEAVLDITGGGPLPTHTILEELGLPPDIAGSLQEISLNTALARDDRFDDVSLDDGISSWFLRRLEPTEVRNIPGALQPATMRTQEAIITDDLRALAVELGDELMYDLESPVEPQNSAAVVLTFPHLRAGTLGWSSRIAGVLPKVSKPRAPVTFRDAVSGKEYVVWLVKQGAYIFGLGDWYKQNDLPAGAYLQLSRGPSDNVILIDYKRRRPKREWVRVANSRDGRLRLETAQRAVACEFDELMSVFVENPAALDDLRGVAPRDVSQAVRESFPEIAKLSPQGNVHARTLYAVVNVITRTSPLDVFAALQSSGSYVPVGDNYWHIGEAH
ncbi:MAG: hypothetical protein M1434_02880 [Chloroflexi bacterium]|nr:hypothetical protein [Chloroflexota bacterium]MCL5273674.1 hypothetical protein [Chloroflexota bacterium]